MFSEVIAARFFAVIFVPSTAVSPFIEETKTLFTPSKVESVTDVLAPEVNTMLPPFPLTSSEKLDVFNVELSTTTLLFAVK